ncbi:ribosome recycling factor [Nemania sp. FL0031]|nr:ribosome recycling factor [Nemania sp. FL0031]
MSNVVARTCLRQGLTWSQTKISSYEVARSSIAGAAAPYSTQPTCQHYYQRLSLVSTAPKSPLWLDLPHSARAFHASPNVYKKKEDKKGGKKSNGKAAESSSSNSNSGSPDDGHKIPQPSPEEPLNFADVEARLSKQAEHSKASLKKLHTGGRFDPEVIGALKVPVDKRGVVSYPLHELAQVVPRGGRTVSLLVHDDGYVKAIMSAVQGSPDFNQQPQRDPDNELELVLKVEPEKPEDLVRRVKALAHEWRERVRAIRQKRDKLHATWKKDGLIGPDLKRTADKELDKVIKTAVVEIDEFEKSAIKAAESK